MGTTRFTEAIEKILKENDMTLRELAEKIGISDVRMNWLYSGRVQPNEFEVVNICKAFNLAREEIL